MFGGGKTQQAYLKKYHPTNLMSCVNDFDTKCFTGYQYWWNVSTNQGKHKFNTMALKDKNICYMFHLPKTALGLQSLIFCRLNASPWGALLGRISSHYMLMKIIFMSLCFKNAFMDGLWMGGFKSFCIISLGLNKVFFFYFIEVHFQWCLTILNAYWKSTCFLSQ